MELKELIHPLEVLEVVGNTDVEISGIQSDSRKVEKGFLFVAVRGTTVDGHDYIQSAIGKGAAAIVCEEIPALSDEDIQVFLHRVTIRPAGPTANTVPTMISSTQ